MKTALQKWRKKCGYKSAFACADAMGINRHTYTDYEQGRIDMSLKTAWEFADFFGISLDDLAGRVTPSKPYADSRQELLNLNYESLDDAGKSAAFGAVAGIAAAYSRGETSQAWTNDYQRRA